MRLFSPFTPTLNYGQLINRASPLNRGLAGAWLALPSRGRGNTWFDSWGTSHGALSGGPIWGGLGAPGQLGSLKFDGSDDLVRTGYAPGAGINADFTIIGVLYQPSRTGEQVHLAFEETGGNGFGGNEVEIANASGQTPRAMWDTAANVISLTDYTLDAWHHVAVTKIGTSFSAYVDGKQQGSSITVSSLAVTSTQTLIMGGSDTGTRRFIGSISAAFVHTRGLSAAEIAAHSREACRGYPTILNRIRLPVVGTAGAAPTTSPFYFRHYIAGRAA